MTCISNIVMFFVPAFPRSLLHETSSPCCPAQGVRVAAVPSPWQEGQGWVTRFSSASDALKPQRSLMLGREMSVHGTKNCLPAGHGNEATQAPGAAPKPGGSSTEQGTAELHFPMSRQRKKSRGHHLRTWTRALQTGSPLSIQLPARIRHASRHFPMRTTAARPAALATSPDHAHLQPNLSMKG